MNLTTAQRHAIRRWTAAQLRARRAYEAEPDAGARTHDGACAVCPKPIDGAGLCHRHRRLAERERGEAGAA